MSRCLAAGLAFATTGFQVAWFSWPHALVNMFVAGTLWAWDRVRESPGDPLRIAVAAGFTRTGSCSGCPGVRRRFSRKTRQCATTLIGPDFWTVV